MNAMIQYPRNPKLAPRIVRNSAFPSFENRLKIIPMGMPMPVPTKNIMKKTRIETIIESFQV